MNDNDNIFIEKIDLSPLPSVIQKCDILINSVIITDPENDGTLLVTVSYSISNETDHDWDSFESRCQLLNARGVIVAENWDTSEVTIESGTKETLKTLIWVANPIVLENLPEKVHVTLTFTACAFTQQHLGQVAIPATPFELTPLKPTKLGNLLTLVSGSISKSEPDDDNNCFIEIMALIQNHTQLFLPAVEVIAPITDRKGRMVANGSFRDEIRPAALATIVRSCHANHKRLADSRMDLTLRAYWPVSFGISQSHGAIINNTSENDTEF